MATPDPAALATPETFRGQPCLRLRLGAHDHVLVALHGAHVLSWTSLGVERLYLSPAAVFDGHSAIRGGVPVCFPQFNDRGSLPKHGFVRNRAWRAGVAQHDAASGSVRLSLQLASDAASLAIWPQAFTLELTLLLSSGALEMTLAARNTGAAAWSFTGALHTYLAVRDLGSVRLEGLHGQPVWDALTGSRATYQGDVRFDGEFDRVFTAAAEPLTLHDAAGALRIAQSDSFANTVVWNPGAAKSATMADLPADGFAHMVCVEAAQVEHAVSLAPGQHWTGWQRLTVA